LLHCNLIDVHEVCGLSPPDGTLKLLEDLRRSLVRKKGRKKRRKKEEKKEGNN
jgi:hypothetical protein